MLTMACGGRMQVLLLNVSSAVEQEARVPWADPGFVCVDALDGPLENRVTVTGQVSFGP
jgi:hypothetical protein